MMHTTDRQSPLRSRSKVVNVLLVYAIKFGGVEDGSKNAQLQQQVTGNSSTSGLILLEVATPMTTGIMMLAHAVLEVKMPTITMMTSMRNVVRN